MKKYLKLIIPSMLLLITTSAFAQIINMNTIYTEIKKEVLANVKHICKGDKYCEDYAVLLTINLNSKKDANKQLRDELDYKQALYNSKYTMTQDIKKSIFVELSELDKISNISTFAEAQAYLKDMPLTKRGYEFAVTMLTLTIRTDEEFNIVKQMVEKLYKEELENSSPTREEYFSLIYDAIQKEKIQACSKDLNIKDYLQDGKMCYLSPIKELSEEEREKKQEQDEENKKIEILKQELKSPTLLDIK